MAVSRPGRVLVVLTSLLVCAAPSCGDDESSTATSTTAPTSAATTSAATDSAATTNTGPADTVETTPTTTALGAPTGAVVIAHRGASAYAPEHTFAAYDLAIEQSADYLEQDLQLTADGELVVLHDEVLDRVARGPADSCTGPVADKTLAQLQECEVGTWFNEAYPDRADPAYVEMRIPTMREIVDRYGTDVRYYIEIKAPDEQPGMEEALLDLLDDTGLTEAAAADPGQVLIQSFSADSLRRLHEARPDLPLVQLIGALSFPVTDEVLDDIATYAVAIGPAVEPLDEALIAAAHERCLAVHPYTVDDSAAITTLLDQGVDGLFTNVPDVFVAARDGHPPPPDHCGR